MTADPTAPEGPRFSANEKNVLLFTGLAHSVTHYVELVYPTLAVMMAIEIGLPTEDILGWSLAGYALMGFGALPAGFLADRYGSRLLVTLGLAVAGVAMLAAGLATPGWPLVLCLAAMGLGASTYHPAGMGLISRTISARGTALGINGIYGNLGIAFSPLITGFLAAAVGWRWTFAVTGGIVLCITALTTRLHFEEPGVVADEVPTETEPSPAFHEKISPLALGTFALLCAAAMFGGFNYRANSIAQPALFAERVQFLHYGLATSLAMCAGIGGQYLGGRIADKYSLTRSYFIFHALSLPAVFLIPYCEEYAMFLALAAFAFFALGMQPIENSLFAELTPERWRATAYGFKFTLTFGLGSSAVAMVDQVVPRSGFVGVYHVLAVVVVWILVAAGTLAVLRRNVATDSNLLPTAPATK